LPSTTMPGAWRRWRGNWASGVRRSIANSRNTGWTPGRPPMLPESRSTSPTALTNPAQCLRGEPKPVKFVHGARTRDSLFERTDAPLAWCGGMVDRLGLRFDRLLLGALTSLLLCAAPSGASAFETVTVNGIEATRILIAPPRTELGRTIRDGLRDAIAATSAGSRARSDADRLYYFYGARHFEPLWLSEAD